MNNGSSTRKQPIKVALLTNFIPPYRLYLYKAINANLENFRIFVSTPMEPNRSWLPEWGDLNVKLQRTLSFQRSSRHPHKFSETSYIHIPYDTLLLLRQYRPNVLISGELGLRTLQAVLYGKHNSNSAVVLWATLSEYTELGRGKLRQILRRWLLQHADAVLVNGESGARYVRQFGVSEDRIFRVPYTTDISAFSSVPLMREPDYQNRLLYVGQLVERKGLHPFLLTLSRWAIDHPKHRLDLWLVGDGPLRTKLERLPIPSNISLRFWGSVGYADLPSIYGQAGIMVFPSLADEWGVVVNEALSSGLPVLGSLYSQAVEELVADNVTGWTFHPDNAAEMYEACNRAFSTPTEVLNKMRGACRERMQHLTPDSVADSILLTIRHVSRAYVINAVANH